MPTALKSLDALVSGMSPGVRTNSNGGPAIFFTNLLGETVPIVPGPPDSTRYLKLGDRQYSGDGSGVEGGGPDGDFDYFLLPTITREQLHRAHVRWGLKTRSFMHGSGGHEGGYHPGKNKRQNLPRAVVDEELSDLGRASGLLGFPAVILVAAQEVIGWLEEQRSYEVFAGSRAVSGGNGHHNGYKA